MSADTAGLHARIAIAGDADRLPAERLLSSARLDCRDLADSIELALSIAINPRLALARFRAGCGTAARVGSGAAACVVYRPAVGTATHGAASSGKPARRRGEP